MFSNTLFIKQSLSERIVLSPCGRPRQFSCRSLSFYLLLTLGGDGLSLVCDTGSCVNVRETIKDEGNETNQRRQRRAEQDGRETKGGRRSKTHSKDTGTM